MPKYHIQTYGCQMNYSDTERMETYLEALGYQKAPEFSESDLIIFNTCSIRQKAEDKVYGQLKKMPALRKENPNLVVAVTGCMVRNSSSRYSSKRDKLFNTMRDLDIALRIEEMHKFAGLMRELEPETGIIPIPEEELEDYFKITAAHNSHGSKAQAFVPVSTGCDKFCTYCIVPFSRGREKSRLIEEIVAECEALVAEGCREITLIGQTVNSYGLSVNDKITKKFTDIPQDKEPFVFLLEQIDKLKDKGLARLRFTSPHPKDMSDQLIAAMATLDTLMPYLHLPVQSGDNRTLKRMNRPYTVERYREIVSQLREKIPNISISTDIIVGFCEESEDEFENTRQFFQELEFDHAYLAQFSERRGTFAEKHLPDDVDPEVKRQRWHELNNILIDTSTRRHQSFIGDTVHVLVESQKDKTCLGRSEHFKTVQFQSGRDLIGQIVPVKVTGSQKWLLEGELV